jgi:uncharacterized protein (TIGR00159 family)
MRNFLPLFYTLRWQDVIDILLNSYILFRLYILFRHTHVFRILIGIPLLWFFQRIAGSLGLILTSWAIQGITAVAALLIIIIFRNEIRSVLQAKSLKAILWEFPRKKIDPPVDIVAASVFELARSRKGGLLVFPAKDDLKEVVQSGLPWQGLISKEMIVSIFWHDNPVHDGAAIIQGDRIAEVGVILPLSLRKDLPSHYGTRHRAAVGLADVTDALVIVISEERGNVLVAKESKVTPVYREDQLVEILREHEGITEKKPDGLRRERLRIGAAAAVSLLFITGVWLSISRGLYTLVTLDVPIEYMNRDPGMEILDTSVNAARLHLSGSGALVKSVRREQIQVKIDLKNTVVGNNTFTIGNENVTLPPGVYLERVSPPVVEVSLDIPQRKELPVQIDWIGKLPPNLILVEARLEPDKVQVIGGKRILDSISTIYTEKVPLDNIKKSGVISVSLAPDPPSLKIAPGQKEKFTVDFVVRERQP